MKKDFQLWWNERYFYTADSVFGPLYRIYERLFKAGADLDYIEGLCLLLIGGDDDIKFAIEDVSKDMPPRLRSLGHPSGLSKRIKEYTEQAMKKLGITLDQNARKDMERGIRRTFKERINRQRQEEDFKRRSESVFRKNPVGGILFEYTSGPLRYSTGRRSDDMGSFFLLALSEHLRKRGGQPRYSLAAKLLQAIRNDQAHISRLDAMVRVDKLKKSHPNWKLHVKALNDLYWKTRKQRTRIATVAKITPLTYRSFLQSLSDALPAG